jgi:hypothetical protein
MAHAASMKQSDRINCLIVCQRNGEVDIPGRLINPAGLIVNKFYNIPGRLADETIAYIKWLVSGEMTLASIKADALRPFVYKSGTVQNNA